MKKIAATLLAVSIVFSLLLCNTNVTAAVSSVSGNVGITFIPPNKPVRPPGVGGGNSYQRDRDRDRLEQDTNQITQPDDTVLIRDPEKPLDEMKPLPQTGSNRSLARYMGVLSMICFLVAAVTMKNISENEAEHK